MAARLYRSQQDKVLGGVCGGLGQYLAIDPVIIRLFFVVLAVADGIGFLMYLILWVVLPKADEAEEDLEARVRSGADEVGEKARSMGSEIRQAAAARDPRLVNWIGGTLILLGAYFLLRNLDLPWLAWFDADLLWPVLLVVAGVVLLLRRGRLVDE